LAMGRIAKGVIEPWKKNPEPDEPEDKAVLKIAVPGELRVRMTSLGIEPTAVAVKAFRDEVKAREEQASLRVLRTKDPNLGLHDLRLRRVRTKRLLED